MTARATIVNSLRTPRGQPVLLFVIANATPRFLEPLLPLFYLYLGLSAARGYRGCERWRWTGALMSAAIFPIFVLSQVPGELGMVWNVFGRS